MGENVELDEISFCWTSTWNCVDPLSVRRGSRLVWMGVQSPQLRRHEYLCKNTSLQGLNLLRKFRPEYGTATLLKSRFVAVEPRNWMGFLLASEGMLAKAP